MTEKCVELLITAGVIPSADGALLARLSQQKREFAAVVLDVFEPNGVPWERVAAEFDRVAPGVAA